MVHTSNIIPCLLSLSALTFGYFVVCLATPKLSSLIKIGAGTAVGLLLLSWSLFIIYAQADWLFAYPVLLVGAGFVGAALAGLACFYKHRPITLKLTPWEILLIVVTLLGSWWLYWHTFTYDTTEHSFQVSAIFWGDNGSHLPLMRSFSQTHNFPPEFPLFPGEHVRYHFLFYFLAAQGERLGANLAYSLNFISALSLTSLVVLIYSFAVRLGRKPLAGFIAIVLTFFNGSLGFYRFFQQHAPLTPGFFDALTQNHEFIGRGPFDGGTIAAFWNLTTFINQRHLPLSLAILLFSLMVFHDSVIAKQSSRWSMIFISVLLALLPFLHSQVFIMAIVFLGTAALIFLRKNLLLPYLVSGIVLISIALPQLVWLQNSTIGASIRGCLPFLCQTNTSKFIAINPGFLIQKPLTPLGIFSWFFWNFGLLLVLLPLALLRQTKKHVLLYLCVLPVLLIGLIFQFGPDLATNHKYFNVWLIISNCYVATLLAWGLTKRFVGKIAVGTCLVLLTLTGILELFPVINTWRIGIADIPQNPVASWVASHTPPNAIFLTSNALYHPVLLTGRKVFLGWQYYAYGAGSDTIGREQIVSAIYTATNPERACQLLRQNSLSYIAIEEGHSDQLYWQNKAFFDQYFLAIYVGAFNNITYTIYEVLPSCQRLGYR